MVKLTTAIDEQTLHALEQRAKRHQRTVEEEAAEILRNALLTDCEAIITRLKQLHAQIGVLQSPSSAELIREDRKR